MFLESSHRELLKKVLVICKTTLLASFSALARSLPGCYIGVKDKLTLTLGIPRVGSCKALRRKYENTI